MNDGKQTQYVFRKHFNNILCLEALIFLRNEIQPGVARKQHSFYSDLVPDTSNDGLNNSRAYLGNVRLGTASTMAKNSNVAFWQQPGVAKKQRTNISKTTIHRDIRFSVSPITRAKWPISRRASFF